MHSLSRCVLPDIQCGLQLGVKVGTEIPSSSTLIFSDRIFEYSSILDVLRIRTPKALEIM